MGKESTCNAGDAGDVGWISRLGRSPRGGNSNPLQYSCLENSMDIGAWWAIVHRISESYAQLKRLSTYTHSKFQVGSCMVWDEPVTWPGSERMTVSVSDCLWVGGPGPQYPHW